MSARGVTGACGFPIDELSRKLGCVIEDSDGVPLAKEETLGRSGDVVELPLVVGPDNEVEELSEPITSLTAEDVLETAGTVVVVVVVVDEAGVLVTESMD